MKRIKYLLLIYALFAVLAYADAVTDSAVPLNELMSSYQLGPGDQIRVVVFREPDLSMDIKLTDAGSIIFPFLGEINVSGLTVGGLKEKNHPGFKWSLYH